jgi:hypothetical protein
VIGAFVAATVVALAQYARVRDRRLLLLASMLALQAGALYDGWGAPWPKLLQLAVCLAGLALALTLSSSSPPTPKG